MLLCCILKPAPSNRNAKSHYLHNLIPRSKSLAILSNLQHYIELNWTGHEIIWIDLIRLVDAENRGSVSSTSLFLNDFQLENMISGDNISLTFMHLLLLDQRTLVMVVVVMVASGNSGMFSFKRYLMLAFARKHYLNLRETKSPKAMPHFCFKGTDP